MYWIVTPLQYEWKLCMANRSENDKEWKVGTDFDVRDLALLKGVYIVTRQTLLTVQSM